MLKKKIMRLVLSMLMALVMLFQGLNLPVYADGSVVDARITNFQILNTSNQPVTETEKSATLKLDFNFEIPEPIFVDTGNYFDIKIPEEFDLTTAVTYPTTFDIKDEDGTTVLGTATVQPNAVTATGGGGNVHVVFNENAKGKYKFKGHLYFDSKINKNRVGDNQTINVKTRVNNREDLTPGSKPIIVKPDKGLSTVEVIGKWAKPPTVPNQAAWAVRINRTKQDLKNVVITDKITSNNGHFIGPDSLPTVITSENFKLMKCEYDASGNPTSYNGEVVDISDKITFNEDKTEFRLDLGDIGTQSYLLSYNSTVEYGDIVQSNNATLTSSTNPTQSSSGTWKYRHSGGEAIGVLAKRLKLRKVDVDDNAPLAGATFKVTKPDGTSFNLTTSADGTAISDQLMQGRYKVKEITAPEGYELNPNEYSVYVYDDVGGTLTVKDKMDKISVKVSKEWVGPKGSSATIHLWADGADTGKSVTLNEGNNWEDTFTNLRKYKPGTTTEIKYAVKEDSVANYDSAVTGDATNGFKVTNTNTEKTTVKVTKAWVGTPAASATVKLLADGAEKETVTLTATDNWTHTFTNLDKYASDGHEIVYTVDETPVAGYTKDISGTAATGFTIKNTNTETINIPVTKTWVGTAGTSATIKLLADGAEKETVTLTAADNWTHTFSNLPKFDTTDGHEIVYTVDEVDVPNYTKGISGTAATGFTVTNTITGKVSVPVTKVWVGPQASSAKVTLFADGVEKDSVTLNAANGWAHTFTNLDKYNNGTEIVYTVTEEPIANYDSVVTGDAATGFKVTNTNTEKTSVDVTKTWVGTPAASVTIKLFADGIEKETVTLTAADNWTHTFANLDKYAADGHEIVYTVDETPVTNYIKAISGDAANGFTITNTITGKVNIPVTKVWVGPEASSAKVTLYADGVEKDSVTLNAANNWVHVFSNLDKYNNGTEIVYTVTEEPIANYDSAITGDVATGFTVTNTNTEKVAVDVTKNWVGPATDSVTIKLLADGAEVESAVITAAENWMHTFSNLPKYAADGHEIVYTVDEYDVPSYVKAIEGTSSTGFTVTNTITGKVDIPVTKVWVGPATDSVTVNLYADGVKVDTVQLTAANQWKHTFANLDKYENGREIVYTVDEVLIPGYKTKITGDVQTGFTITNSKETPKTADHVNPMAYASIFVISLMAAIMTMIEKKKFAR